MALIFGQRHVFGFLVCAGLSYLMLALHAGHPNPFAGNVFGASCRSSLEAPTVRNAPCCRSLIPTSVMPLTIASHKGQEYILIFDRAAPVGAPCSPGRWLHANLCSGFYISSSLAVISVVFLTGSFQSSFWPAMHWSIIIDKTDSFSESLAMG